MYLHANVNIQKVRENEKIEKKDDNSSKIVYGVHGNYESRSERA